MGFEYYPLGKITVSDIIGTKLPAEKANAILKDVIYRYKDDRDFFYYSLINYLEEYIEKGHCELHSFTAPNDFIKHVCLLSVLKPPYKFFISIGRDNLFRAEYSLVNGFINNYCYYFCDDQEEIRKLRPVVYRDEPTAELNFSTISDFDCWHDDEMSIKLTNSRFRDDVVSRHNF